MKPKKEFLLRERENLIATFNLLQETLKRKVQGKPEQIACATLIANLYTGMENIIRFLCQDKQLTISSKSGAWHKDLLKTAQEQGIITNDLYATLLQFLVFRHYHVHGYGHLIDPERLQPLADQASQLLNDFLEEIGIREI